MTAEPAVPAMAMESERQRDLDGTGNFRHNRWDDDGQRQPPPPSPPHPVKDIVLPLAVVIGLIANALMIGVAWGRFSQRMDTYEASQLRQEQRITKAEEGVLSLRDRMHDAERDIKEAERRFLLLDDYTRGRIDKLPYHAPSAARW